MSRLTVICDLDGTLIKHQGDLSACITSEPEILPGVLDQWLAWERAGNYLLIVTGRPESARDRTIEQITKVGLFCHQLIMGVGGAPRLLINDTKPDNPHTARAVVVPRNCGFVPFPPIDDSLTYPCVAQAFKTSPFDAGRNMTGGHYEL